jgi:hypothetical protein
MASTPERGFSRRSLTCLEGESAPPSPFQRSLRSLPPLLALGFFLAAGRSRVLRPERNIPLDLLPALFMAWRNSLHDLITIPRSVLLKHPRRPPERDASLEGALEKRSGKAKPLYHVPAIPRSPSHTSWVLRLAQINGNWHPATRSWAKPSRVWRNDSILKSRL